MRALMVQQGCDAALETLPADMKAGEKAALKKKAYSTLILCLGDRVLRKVTKETNAAGIWTKLTSLYMTKSLANRLYLKKKLYTYYMSPCTKLGDHIDKFNKLILDLVNIDIEIEDEDQALMLLTSLPSSYENFMERLLYGRESLTMEDVLATLNSRELRKRTEGTKEEAGDRLYVRGRSDHSGKAHYDRSLWFKLRGGTSKLKCFICHSEGHLKIDCPMKKSSGFVKKGKRDQDSDSSDDNGITYFGEALVVVRNDEMTQLVMDTGDNRICTIKGTGKLKIQLHDGSSFMLEDVRYVPGLRRSLISLGTLEKEGYNVKMQLGRIKVIKGCWVMMTKIRKKNRVYTLEEKVMTFGVKKHGGSKQVGFKQLGHKQVGFKQLGNQSIECDHLNEIGMIIREVFVKLLLDSFGKLSISLYDSTLYVLLCYVLIITVIGFKGELHENTQDREILFLYCYPFSVSLLLTPLCCDDIHDVTPRVSALAGYDNCNLD
ncbi:zinc finger, CCHC-type containing protein [Tanacetum coccineum]|uniref:Zinc finger, CCHC-type containing protein n=1 Tax=Tanacetum coccineum TaxID=301880 RepID=A0ABQ5GZX7_9ASTR